MLKNHLVLTIRNLVNRKGYTLVNLFGLATGITCCLLIFAYVAYERSYDSFHEKADRIYRVQDEDYQKGTLAVPCAAAMPGVAPAMLREFPEVENAFRLRKMEYLVANEEKNLRFRESSVYFADQALLEIFHLPLVEGDAKTALTGPGKIILSETEAHKYFGPENPIGKSITIHGGDGPRLLQVTGVFRDYPNNSHLKFSILISYPTYRVFIGTHGKSVDVLETSFGWTDFYTYILLRKGTDPKRLAAKLPEFMGRHYNNLPENKGSGDSLSLSLIPLKDIHLYSHYTEEAEANGDGQSVSFLFLIAFFILGIAWINYINLATARSVERAREVGVRKVLGALRSGLIGQFLLESLLLNLISLFTAILVTLILSPLFSKLAGRPLSIFFSISTGYWVIFAALFALGTLLSGFYPALVLSRYQPVSVLKGLFKNAAGGKWLRKGLIVGQFAASVILIAGTMIVYRQLQFMQNKKLGANIDQTLVIKGPNSEISDSSYHDTYQAFKEDLLRTRGIKSVTSSSAVMGKEILWSTDWRRMTPGNKLVVNLFHLGVDKDFVGSFGLKILAGRNFSPTYGTERRSILLNQTALKVFGITSPQAAIGELISGGQNNMDSMQVVGVVADFHNEGLQKAIQPLAFLYNRNIRSYYSIKLEGTDPVTSIAAIKKIWAQHFSADPYDYFFLDEFFNQQYAENQRFGEVFALFAMLAIAIACFGLLGLSAYNVLQRTKEIGIRKVLGASVQSLIIVLTRDFLVLVLLSLIIAFPLTWILMDSWLQGFAYRIGINWWIFGLSGLLALMIAFMTVGGQALRAAMTNPVKNLRWE